MTKKGRKGNPATRKVKGAGDVHSEVNFTPAGYEGFLELLKDQIKTAQLRAAVSVNTQAIELYYNIGKAIVSSQEQSGWGDAVLKRLSKDLVSAFPEMKGFSERNLYRMRTFYLAYRGDSDIFATAVAKIPWGHNIVILDKVKQPEERSWYVAKTLEHGWSRSILEMQIESTLYQRQGRSVTNFSRTLPALQSDLAQQVLKDPYNFDFLTLDAEAHERDIETALVHHIQKFLIELGVGFAFVGRQFHLDIGEQDFYIDLLFYHLRLRCYVKPIGISEFLLTESLPDSLRGQLPTIEELEQELSSVDIVESE